MQDFEIGNASRNSVVNAITSNGTAISIEPEEAYYKYRLTLEDLFTIEDCDRVLASMTQLDIISCDDSMEVIHYGSSNCSTFTKDDVLSIRKSLK